VFLPVAYVITLGHMQAGSIRTADTPAARVKKFKASSLTT